MKPKILVLGAGYAGIMAANRFEKQVKNAEVVLISESTKFKERIRYHEAATTNQLKEIEIKDLLRTRVRFLQSKVNQIRPKEKSVVIEGNPHPIHYDYLIIALGSSYIRSLDSSADSIQSQEAVSEFLKKNRKREIQKLCIVGGGLTGIEMATEWKHFNPHSSVTIIDRGELGSTFSNKARKYLRTYMLDKDIQILDKTNIKRILKNEMILENQTKLSFDCLLNCSGFESSPLLKNSDFHTNILNQVYVDPFLRAHEYPEVFIAGDSAYLENSFLRMGCVTALPMGAYIADHIANVINGKNLIPFAFKFVGRCVSLGRGKGLIQFTFANDKPKEWIIKGKWGAVIKELVNRFTIFSLRMEKLLPFRFYFWPKGNLLKFEEKNLTKIFSTGDTIA